MSYFARKLRYMAHDGDGGSQYVALIELSTRKGGTPVEFVLYWYTSRYFYLPHHEFKMFCFKARTSDEAILRFWPSGENGKEFPDYQGDGWRRTTGWLALVAAGGGYERFGYHHDSKGIRVGTWMKVCKPSPWSKRRARKKKKPLQFGNLAHIVLVRQAEIRGLKEEKASLIDRLSELSVYDEEADEIFPPQEGDVNYAEYMRIDSEVVQIELDIISLNTAIEATRAEMRFKVHRMFPKPLVA